MTAKEIPNPLNKENQDGPSGNQSPPQTSPTEFEVLRNQVSQQQALLEQIASSLQRNNAPPPPPPTRYDFSSEDWQDPAKAPNLIADIIRKETAQAVAPLMEFRQKYERSNQYQQIKNQVKNSNPTFAKLWNHIEPYLDQTFSAGNVDVNAQIVAYQAQAIIGSLALNQPQLFSGNGSPPPSMIPPSGAPPRGSDTNNEPKLRDLTENEEILRKARGLTKEQFLKIQDVGDTLILPPASERGKK